MEPLPRSRIGGIDELVELALIRAKGGSATGGGATFVFRPGGVASGNVFTTEATLRTAVAATQGPVVIECDNSLAPVVFAGSNFGARGDVTIQGKGALPDFTPITINGTMTGVGLYRSLNITYNAAVPGNIATTAFGASTLDGCNVTCTGTAPFVRAPAGISAGLWIFNTSFIATGATPAFDAVGVGARLDTVWFSAASAQPNTLAQSGGGATTATITSTSCQVSPTQPGVPGFATTLLNTSDNELYNDNLSPTPGKFNTATVQATLDEIKRLSELYFATNVGPVATNPGAPTVVATLAVIDLLSNEALEIGVTISVVAAGSAVGNTSTLRVLVNGVPVQTTVNQNWGAGSVYNTSVVGFKFIPGAPGNYTVSFDVQEGGAQSGTIAANASILTARRVLALP